MILNRALLVAAMTVAVSACGQTHRSPATHDAGATAPARTTTTTPTAPQSASQRTTMKTPEQQESRMWMTVGERRFALTLSDNAAARAFAEQLPLTLDMAELNGNEKHTALPKSLPADASRPGTIRNGDLMLYGTDTLVVFYATFQSSYSYTPLGRVADPADLPAALGARGVRVVFSKD